MKKAFLHFFIFLTASFLVPSAVMADQSYTGDISGGNITRNSDGVSGELVTVKGVPGGNLNISGGNFTTANPQIYTNGVVVTRDDNIRLYNASSPNGHGGYNMHTVQSVEEAYANGNTAQFAPANHPDQIPSKADVLHALSAAQDMAATARINAWQLSADENINVTGGNFDFTTTNVSSIHAGGFLDWSNASLLSSGGGGSMTINAVKGINIESGSIRSMGYGAGGPYVIKYDDRGRLNRDRWTLGNYLYLQTDGDITLGRKGAATGPDVYVSDGMLFFTDSKGGAAPGSLYINSGSLTLAGEYRSTLNTGSMAQTVIDGGSLNVLTSDRINRNGVDSATMYLGDTTLQSGSINLYNGQMGGAVTVNGGVINALGDSSINSGAKAVNINAGVVNLGPKAFIGAIKGDSPAISPYVTSSAEVNIGSDAKVNLLLSQPDSGDPLVVGQNIGGIYTINGSSPTSIHIANGAAINLINPYAAGIGEQTVAGFAQAENGTVTAGDIQVRANTWYDLKLVPGENGMDLKIRINDPADAVRMLPGNDNVQDNGESYADMLMNGTGNWALFSAAVIAADPAKSAEMLRQAGGENVAANAYAIMSTVKEMEKASRSRGFNAMSPVSEANTQDLGHGNQLWINGVGITANQGSRNDITGYWNQAAGLVAGFDHTFDDSFMAGVAVGYARGYFESNDGLASGHSDNWFASLYGSMKFDSLGLDADVFYARTITDMDTNISGWSSSSDTVGASSLGASLTASYKFDFNDGATSIAPYVGIEYLGINQDSWSSGGTLPRDFDSEFSTLWTLPVGVRFAHEFRGNDWALTTALSAGYARDLNDFRPEANISIPGMNGTIESKAVKMDKDSFRGAVNLNFQKNDFSVTLQYNLDARERYTSHGGTLGVAWSF